MVNKYVPIIGIVSVLVFGSSVSAQSLEQKAQIGSPSPGATFTPDSSGICPVAITSDDSATYVKLTGPYTGTISWSFTITAYQYTNLVVPFEQTVSEDPNANISSISGSESISLTSTTFFKKNAFMNANAIYLNSSSSSYPAWARATAYGDYTGAAPHGIATGDVAFTINGKP